MLSGGAEELVLVSFHVQLQGRLMYMGDIAITIQLKDCPFPGRDGYETFVVFYLIWPLLRRTLRSGMLSADTSSCKT